MSEAMRAAAEEAFSRAWYTDQLSPMASLGVALEAALSADRERDRPVEENERYRKALEFYADERMYDYDVDCVPASPQRYPRSHREAGAISGILIDEGWTAREALSSSPTEEYGTSFWRCQKCQRTNSLTEATCYYCGDESPRPLSSPTEK